MRVFALALSALVVASSGCQPISPPASVAGAGSPAQPASRTILPASAATADSQQRPLSPGLAPLGVATLIGKVKLIGEGGLGVISNNSGALISDKGGSLIGEGGLGLISDRGGALVSNNGGAIVGANGGSYQTLGADGPQESWLAHALIEVVDAAGQVLKDEAGEPLRAVTDETGSYMLEATLPKETLVLRVRTHAGGTLLSLLPREVGSGGTWQVPIDTASSLGAAYVLERYVQSRQDVLDRLPGFEAVALYGAMAAAAREGLEGAPDYGLARQVEVAERLRGAAEGLDGTLERIEALLLAGQSRLGEGRLATEVALSSPKAAIEDGFGGLLIAEAAGRIRRVDAEGRLSLFLGDGAGDPEGLGSNMTGIGDLAADRGGGWLVSEPFAQRVRRIAPDGTVSVVAGSGQRGAGPTDLPATEASLDIPTTLAVGPDGAFYIGEQPRGVSQSGRILRVDREGVLTEVPCPEPAWRTGRISGLAAGPGVLWAVEGSKGLLAKKEGSGPWVFVARDLATNADSRLWLDADGTLYMSETRAHRVLAFGPDGQRRVVAGTGAGGSSGDGGPAVAAALSHPAGLWRSPAGELVVVDGGNARVRAVDAQGTIRALAGSLSTEQAGEAVGLAVNRPRGLAVDARNRILISEGAGGTIKRLEDGVIGVFAGTVSGFGGDGGPASAAALDDPYGLAFSGETLYVVDTENMRVRRIDPDGTIATVIGTGVRGGIGALRRPALETGLFVPTGLAIGPDGLPTIADAGGMVVIRLTAEGECVLVAGDQNGVKGFAGDGGAAATTSELNNPTSVAYDAEGNLYIADTGNFRIRKVDTAGVITTIAGVEPTVMITRLLGGRTGDPDGSLAREASLFGPTALCFDAAGNLYFAEHGTANIDALASDFPASLLEGVPSIGSRIRRITPEGRIEAVAGDGTSLFPDPLGDQAIKTPLALAFDLEGRLIVADTGNNQVKVIPRDRL